MTARRDFVGVGIARSLVDQLESEPSRYAPVFYDVHHPDIYYARRCRNGSAGFTGGLALWVDVFIPDSMVGKKFLTFRRNLGPGWTRRQVEYAMSLLSRKAVQERWRQAPLNHALAIADALAVPHQDDPAFRDAVAKRETIVGESRYDLMTLDQINDWIDWLKTNYPQEATNGEKPE